MDENAIRTMEALVSACDVIINACQSNIIDSITAKSHLEIYLKEIDIMCTRAVSYGV